jgi:hypothetical protein
MKHRNESELGPRLARHENPDMSSLFDEVWRAKRRL